MTCKPYTRRGIAARVLRPGILILLALCFLTHSGSVFAQGPLSRTVDLLSPPASAPDLVAACAQAPVVQEFGAAFWFLPPCRHDLTAAVAPLGAHPNPAIVQRPPRKIYATPALPRPPPFSLFS